MPRSKGTQLSRALEPGLKPAEFSHDELVRRLVQLIERSRSDQRHPTIRRTGFIHVSQIGGEFDQDGETTSEATAVDPEVRKAA